MTTTELWLAAFCILCGYQLFWATYSFSGYLQNIYGMTAVAVGSITVAKLWMRPIGAIAAGFVGDRFNLEKVLAGLMLAGSVALSRVLESLVFGITAHDIPTYGAVTALLGTVAVAACYLPARKAARMDPMETLRGE